MTDSTPMANPTQHQPFKRSRPISKPLLKCFGRDNVSSIGLTLCRSRKVKRLVLTPAPRLLYSRASLALQTGERRAQVSLDRTINKMDDPPRPHLAPATPARSWRPAHLSGQHFGTLHLFFFFRNRSWCGQPAFFHSVLL